MPWRKNTWVSKGGKKSKKLADGGSSLSELQRKLAEIKKEAPPDPENSLLDWLTINYGFFCNLKDLEIKGLIALADTKDVVTKNKVLRVIIEETAAGHVGDKQKQKYVKILQNAWNKDISVLGLRKFIRDSGGINRCAAGGNSNASKPFGRNSDSIKPRK
jgi:hypothetical protein